MNVIYAQNCPCITRDDLNKEIRLSFETDSRVQETVSCIVEISPRIRKMFMTMGHVYNDLLSCRIQTSTKSPDVINVNVLRTAKHYSDQETVWALCKSQSWVCRVFGTRNRSVLTV